MRTLILPIRLYSVDSVADGKGWIPGTKGRDREAPRSSSIVLSLIDQLRLYRAVGTGIQDLRRGPHNAPGATTFSASHHSNSNWSPLLSRFSSPSLKRLSVMCRFLTYGIRWRCGHWNPTQLRLTPTERCNNVNCGFSLTHQLGAHHSCEARGCCIDVKVGRRVLVRRSLHTRCPTCRDLATTRRRRRE
jgi:hypothetical protein